MKSKIFVGEFIGSALLVMAIVGSGIMAESLTNDTAVMLLANAVATGAALYFLIVSISDISGAHFNPFVTLAMYLSKKIKSQLLPVYFTAQILGCLTGVMLANFFFDYSLIELSSKSRSGINVFVSEIIATFGLIFIIFRTIQGGKVLVATSVATFITAGYWFTSSTSFANPAVAIARTFTNTFTGINYLNTPFFIIAELIGTLFAIYILRKLKN